MGEGDKTTVAPDAPVTAAPDAAVTATPDTTVTAAPDTTLTATPDAAVRATPDAPVSAAPDGASGTAQDARATGSAASVGAGKEAWTDGATTFAEVRRGLAGFVADRHWERFHTPKDLAIAVSVEAGELLQLFLWVDPAIPGGRPAPDRQRLEAELADVAITLLNLCNRTGIDLASAIARKLEHNAAKYPVERARGSALKYDEYAADAGSGGRDEGA